MTSLYSDTPILDVFHRTQGYKRTKFRLRRYDGTPHLFLERKTKRNDQVHKRRSQISADELAYLTAPADVAPPTAWAGQWFLKRIRQRGLRPTCCVTYQRAAFFGMAGDAPIRMTLDRDVTGLPAADWAVPRIDGGQSLLPGSVLLEMKFHLQLPPVFRDLLTLLPGQASKASKYRRCVTECGLWDGTPHPGAAQAAAAKLAAAAGVSAIDRFVDNAAPAPAGAVDARPAATAEDVPLPTAETA